LFDEGEDVAFTELAELARDANEDKWESKVDKYVNDEFMPSSSKSSTTFITLECNFPFFN
jgi:hypothetical protein